jgi:hypothetical protein
MYEILDGIDVYLFPHPKHFWYRLTWKTFQSAGDDRVGTIGTDIVVVLPPASQNVANFNALAVSFSCYEAAALVRVQTRYST